MPLSQFITPITANCARTKATGRSASSTCSRLSETAWGSGRTTATSIKVMQDADAIVMDAADLIAQHGIDADMARRVVLQGMLGDQPLPLKRAAAQSFGQVVPS